MLIIVRRRFLLFRVYAEPTVSQASSASSHRFRNERANELIHTAIKLTCRLTWVFAHFPTVVITNANLSGLLARFIVLTWRKSCTVKFIYVWRESRRTVVYFALPRLESFVELSYCCKRHQNKGDHLLRHSQHFLCDKYTLTLKENCPEIPCPNLPALPLM